MKMKLLLILAALVAAAFVLLLAVGYENVLALFRYRITLFLAIGPIFGLFLWCVYKAFDRTPKSRTGPGQDPRLGR
jgi:hypothetical protein